MWPCAVILCLREASILAGADEIDHAPRALPPGFDLAALGEALREVLPDAVGPIRVERISGGQSNPTFRLDAGPHRLILRKRPDGPLLSSAHAIDREVRVLRALGGTAVPVPRVILSCDDPQLIGTSFYIMERLDGRVFHDGAMPGLASDDRRAIVFSMADTLAKLHAVRPEAVGLGDFGRPGRYFRRQIERWRRQWMASPSAGTIPALDEVAAWLDAHEPLGDDPVAIAHGDFRLGNLMIAPAAPQVIGVLDWELSTLGHPLADLAFCCLAWHLGPEDFAGIAGLDHARLGLPSQAEFVARYRAGAPPVGPLLPFHLAFALFRFAVIFVGIADRVRAGTAAGRDAAAIGPLASRFAGLALDIVVRQRID